VSVPDLVQRLVGFCHRRALAVVTLVLLMAIGCGYYVAGHLRVTTDTTAILSPDLEWRKTERELREAFPQKLGLILVIIDGRTAELAEDAATRLAARLRGQPELFMAARRPEGGDFFRKNGLLYLPPEELRAVSDQIVRAQPLLGGLAVDPSMRGLLDVLSDVFKGVELGQFEAQSLAGPLDTIARAIDTGLAGQGDPVSWQTLLTGREPTSRELRRFIMAQPNRDFGSIQPGRKAIEALRQAIDELALTPENGVRVRFTGEVPIADEEFATVAEGTNIALKLSMVLVVILLFLALRSWRLIVPILLTLACGLVGTAAFAALAIGSLNVISVSFAVLFVGIGVDFGIQFAVRYRQERFAEPDLARALGIAGHRIAGALLLAALATAAGFFSFMPTDFRGVSELGLISGAGMLIAATLNLSLLPALLSLFRPKGEQEAAGYLWAAPLDSWIQRNRKPVLFFCLLAAVGSVALLPQLRFDMNPLNLKDQRTEAVGTLRELMADPNTTPYTIELLAPSVDAAATLAERIGAAREVSRVITARSFVPRDQERKLEIIADLKDVLGLTLTPLSRATPPKPADIVAAAARLRQQIARAAEVRAPQGAAAETFRTLDRAMARYLDADAAARDRADRAVLGGLLPQIESLRLALQAAPVSVENLPPELREFWIAADGRARIEVFPSGDSRDNDVLEAFVGAVSAIAGPKITGTPVTIHESAKTVVSAFVTAGLLAILSITLILFVTLRRPMDVFQVLAPLVLAGLMTLAVTVVIGLELNYANVIALPLLLGIGVAYSIYFVMIWRQGQEGYLQSPTARAILFSALTTGSAFGTLAISSHEGTAGMGLLLTISLVCMLICTLFAQPALLALAGPYRAPVPEPSGETARQPV